MTITRCKQLFFASLFALYIYQKHFASIRCGSHGTNKCLKKAQNVNEQKQNFRENVNTKRTKRNEIRYMRPYAYHAAPMYARKVK